MKLELNGTKFEFSILPLREGQDDYWVNVCFVVDNKNIKFERIGEYLTRDELKRLISATQLLLKGKLLKSYSLDIIEPGVEIELIPSVGLHYMSEDQRATAPCHIKFEFPIFNEETQTWGNASILIQLQRKDVEKLYKELKQEYDLIFFKPSDNGVLPYLLVRDETREFRFSILGYEFGSPLEKVDWDEDWLEIIVEFYKNGEKYRYIDASLTTIDFEEMIMGLEGLLWTDKGEYHSDFLEPDFQLNAFKNGDQFKIEAKFFNDPEADDYNWEKTETYAREICDKKEFIKKVYSLKSMLEMFPPRDGKKRNKPSITVRSIDEENSDYLYVGVSPKGRYGCNYWYIDEAKQTQADTYVWVNMGNKKTEQLVYVDSVRYCNENNVPYPIEKTKRVLRQATQEEMEQADVLWDE